MYCYMALKNIRDEFHRESLMTKCQCFAAFITNSLIDICADISLT